MIPALRGLSNLQVSFGSATDVSMAIADSVLGKRLAGEEEEVQGAALDLSLGLTYRGTAEGGRSEERQEAYLANRTESSSRWQDNFQANRTCEIFKAGEATYVDSPGEMSCLTFNYRGARNNSTVRELALLSQVWSPKFVFLSETRQDKNKMRRLRHRLGLKGFVGSSSNGMSGGLALFWHEQFFVEVKHVNERFIDAYVRVSPNAPLWRITCVYGEPCVEDRHRMWDSLRNLKLESDLPWVVIGDFNEALWQEEHLSCTPRPVSQMEAFHEVLFDCNLTDLGFSGVPYTYDNKRARRANVRVRLDRAVACPAWRDLFADTQVQHLTSPVSDHCPVLMQVEQEIRVPPRQPRRQYEIMWERESELSEKVAEAWKNTGHKVDLGDIMKALDGVMTSLQGWSKKKFGNVLQEIKKARERLEVLKLNNVDSQSIRQASNHMQALLYKEEMLWLPRLRISWLKEGDRNTRFFHQKAVWRARRNKIKKLKDDDGIWKDAPTDMERMATSYFKKLFTRDPSLNSERLLALTQQKVTNEMNENLCKDFTDEEISDALFQIGPLKAPGVDGFPACFYQRNWGTIKEEIINAVKLFSVSGKMPEGVNETAIVLIPKTDQPESLKEFRPISLCTVLYKVISKCMVNRLRPILGEIISINQSAFVPGRLITDNALVAFECLHFIKQNNNANKDFCAYKLDLSKAYDRVDWVFLKNVMQRMGFSYRWVDWIMAFVTSVSYKVKINGNLLDSFSPSRGLRQGDPLSPFLFLFVADGLSTLLQKEVTEQNIDALRVCRSAPRVSHLLFADDSLLFFKARGDQAARIKGVLDIYASSMGQLINPSKCSILFGHICPVARRMEVKNTLAVVQETFETKYLGQPTPEGRMGKEKFESLQARLAKCLIEWDDDDPQV
jgi:exonuclease III